MKKTVLTSVALGLVSLTALTGCSNGGFQKDTIKIGVTGPLTGGAAAYGLGVKNAAEMAVEEINAAGGLNGKKFSFEATDDVLDADKAKQNFNTLFEKGMQISLGAVTSGAAIAFGAKASENNVFALTPSASADAVPASGIYQMCFSDSGQGTAAAEYVNSEYSDKTVGIFYDSSDAYSTGILATFKAAYEGTPVEASFSSQAKETDFTNQVEALKNCEFIFLPIYYTEASMFIAKAKSKVSADTVFYGCDGLDGIDHVEGFDVTAVSQEISYLSHFNPKSEAQKTVTFIAKYTEKYGESTLNQFGASAYDSVYAIYNALKEVEDAGTHTFTTDEAASVYNQYLSAKFQGGFTYSGVTGDNISWTASRTVSKNATKVVVNK